MREGFTRVKVDGEQRLLEEAIGARQEVQAHDRGRRRPARDAADLRTRLTQSIETAAAAGRRARRDRPARGRRAAASSPRTSRAPSTASRCPSCSRASSPSTRRTAPARAARASARSRRSTPSCVVPDPDALDRRGRARAVVGRAHRLLRVGIIQAIADRYEIDSTTPWQELAEQRAEPLPLRHGGERIYVSYRTGWAAAAPTRLALRGHRREPPAALPRDRLRKPARADRGVHVASGRARSARARGSSPRCSR